MAKKLYRIVETTRFEVRADDETEAVRLFEEHIALAVDEPVRYVGVDDRKVEQLTDERGRRTVVAAP